jgi:large-conductance mechanosensitive channel
MIDFLLDEGILTVGTLSGVFMTGLLNSLKKNIIDPSFEIVLPSHKLDTDSKTGFGDMFPLPIGNTTSSGPVSNIIKWQTFLKDFVIWIILMSLLYLFWKKVLHPRKSSKIFHHKIG